MKIIILKGGRGFISECSVKVLKSTLKVTVSGVESGKLYVGSSCANLSGSVAEVPEYYFLYGRNRIRVEDSGGRVYECGEILREGRFISVKYDLEGLILDLVRDNCELWDHVSELERKVASIEEKIGISIV